MTSSYDLPPYTVVNMHFMQCSLPDCDIEYEISRDHYHELCVKHRGNADLMPTDGGLPCVLTPNTAANIHRGEVYHSTHRSYGPCEFPECGKTGTFRPDHVIFKWRIARYFEAICVDHIAVKESPQALVALKEFKRERAQRLAEYEKLPLDEKVSRLGVQDGRCTIDGQTLYVRNGKVMEWTVEQPVAQPVEQPVKQSKWKFWK